MSKKDKKGKKDKKKDKRAVDGGVPHEVAAVKVSKGLRKAGKAAMKLAEQPVVSEAVASALLMAAAALRERPKKTAAAEGAGVAQGGANGGGHAVAAPGAGGSMVGDALKAIAIDVAKRTVDAWGESAKKARKEPAAGASGEPPQGG